MFSKMLGAVLLSTLFLIGCADESEPHFNTPKIELSGARCLSTIGGKLDDYAQGLASESDVEATWDCLSSVLDTFTNYVRGKTKNTYTPREIRVFLEKHFLAEDRKRAHGGVVLSDELVVEIMRIKRLFLGGSIHEISKQELLRGIELSQNLKSVSLKLRPHIAWLLASENKRKPTTEDLNAANRSLHAAFAQVSGLLQKGEEARYEFSHLKNFLRELNNFVAVSRPTTTIGELAKYVDLAAQIKATWLNSQSRSIEPHEWDEIMDFIARGGDIYLRVRHCFREAVPWAQSRLQLDGIQNLLDTGFDLLSESVERRGLAGIGTPELESLIDAFEKSDLWPEILPASEAKKILGWFTDRFLSPPGVAAPSGLTTAKVAYLQARAQDWVDVQNLLVLGKEESAHAGWREMSEVLASPVSLSLDEHSRVAIVPAQATTNLAGATRLNLLRVAFSMLFRAHQEAAIDVASASFSELKLAPEVLHETYLKILPLLAALDLFEADDQEGDARILRDADLFMPRSAGDRQLSAVEALEYAHLVFGGIDAGKYFIRHLPASCWVAEDGSVTWVATNEVAKFVDLECFRKNFATIRGDGFSHLPKFLEYFSAPQTDRRQDVLNLETSVRADPKSSGPMARADVYEAFVILQYMEVLMLRFDQDNSKRLDIAEALVAFDHFKNTVGKMVSLDPESEREELLTLFTYLLRYGEVPNPAEAISPMRFLNWQWKKERWTLDVDRGGILRILAALQTL